MMLDMKFLRKIFLPTVLFFLCFPFFSSEYPSSLSKEAVISIINVNYSKNLAQPFSKAVLRIYDRENYFDEVVDFSFFNDFDDPLFAIKFYFLVKKAEIVSLPFLDFAEREKQSGAELYEMLLNLTYDELSYIFAFLKNLNESLPDYSYDFDLKTSSSFTHISAILNDCDRYCNKNASYRSFYNYSRKLSTRWILQSSPLPMEVFVSNNNYASSDENSPVKLSNGSFKTILCLSIISFIIFLFTLYQTVVLFIKKIYIDLLFKIIQNLDFLILFFSGLIGTFILIKLYSSSQSLFRNNFRFLYLFPFNIVMAFNIYFPFIRKKLFIKTYWLSVSFLNALYIILSSIALKEFQLLDFFTAFPLFIRSVYFAFYALYKRNKKGPEKHRTLKNLINFLRKAVNS